MERRENGGDEEGPYPPRTGLAQKKCAFPGSVQTPGTHVAIVSSCSHGLRASRPRESTGRRSASSPVPLAVSSVLCIDPRRACNAQPAVCNDGQQAHATLHSLPTTA